MAKRKPATPKVPKVVDPTARLVGKYVAGEGDLSARYFLLGESPGKVEAEQGRPFVGSSGEMFWSKNPTQFPGILDGLNLPRADFYITNVLKQRIADDKDPTPAEIAHFRPMLEQEIARVNPDVIIAAGGFATRVLLGPGVSMDLVHGLPHWSDEFSLPVVPCLHPAAGLHDTDSMAAVYWDYAQAAAFIRGDLGLHAVTSDPVQIQPLPDQLLSYPHLAADTETLIDGSTWCMTVSWADGRAAFIPADDRAAIARFAAWTRDRACTLFMHHALHDIRAMRQFDIDLAQALIWDATDDRGRPVHSARLIDTMVLAFNRGKIDAQGLKALAYRRLNRKMRSYEDVVGPYQQQMAYDYLLRLLGEAYAGAFPEPVETASVVDGKVKISKPWSLARRLERLLADFDAAPSDTDLVKRWTSIDDSVREPAERLCGPLPRADLSHVPFEEAALYACDDAASTRALGMLFWPQHKDRDLIRIATVDHGAMPLIGRMVDNGMPARRQYFLDLGAEMRVLQAEMVAILETVVGYPVNPNSSDQVADLVFNVLGLEAVKTTPGGKPSTGKKALQHLRDHPMVEWILQSRELGKIETAFCENIASRVVDLADASERVYTDLLHTRVKTGRLASKNPNLLAIPTRTKLGMRVRAGFIAPPGRMLGAWDMSQVEMRTLADRSGDPDLISAYIEGRDLHTETAAAVFGVKIADVTKTQRTVSKSISFGVIMGITGRGLVDQIRLYGLDPADWPADRCDEYIEEWLRVYKGVRDYQFRRRAEARRYGYVQDMFGRRYDLPHARCPLSWIREEALRQSHALDIQGSAQGLMKRAMRAIETELIPACAVIGLDVRPVLFVHDEFIIEMPEGAEELVHPMMEHAMTKTTLFASGVPLETGHGFGRSWADLK